MNKELRLRLCESPVVDDQGNINQAYFADIPGAHWSNSDEELLIKGIENFGVGAYEQINRNLLPNKNPIELRLRTCMMLGAHNIEEFTGLKDISRIPTIKAKNLAAAKKSGKLKFGIYLN